MDKAQRLDRTWLDRSRIALGIGVITLVSLVETVNIDRITPNPASPVVWTVLGLIGAASLACAVWCRSKARRAVA
jgi:hypothetical protein